MINLQFAPVLSPEITAEHLGRLIVRGEIRDRDMDSRIARLGDRFRICSSTCPHGLWAPGLALTNEVRNAVENYLPMADIRNTFHRFFSVSLGYPAATTKSAIDNSPTWFDALQQLRPHVTGCDPAALLRRLMSEESFRIGFLFALFLPKRHGGGFNRYPGQVVFLRHWLMKRARVGIDRLRCLDAACATGESTYELAMLLLENGMKSNSFMVHGSTIEPLELFAAAHIFYPHDPKRQEAFRKTTEPVFAAGADKSMLFFTEDISRLLDVERKDYDIILCNGLLGGPEFHTTADLGAAVSALGSRLRKGGILLAADRFHGGWKKSVPTSLLHEILTKSGFRVRDIGDGLAAEKI